MADEFRHCVKIVSLHGVVLRQWCWAGSKPGTLYLPCSVAVRGDGSIVVADCNHRVQVFQTDGTFLCAWGSYGYATGQFKCMAGLAVSRAGLVLVGDHVNPRVQIFE